MSLSKKAQLYTSFPLIVVSIIFIVLLMVALHIMVISADNDSEEENSRGDPSSSYSIDNSFLLRDFLMTPLNETQINKIPLEVEKETFTLMDALMTSSSEEYRTIVFSIYNQTREKYLEDNFKYISNYLKLNSVQYSKEELFHYRYFEVKELKDDLNPSAGKVSLNTQTLCNYFSKSEFLVLPVKTNYINNYIVVVSLSPFSKSCLEESFGGFTNE